LLLIVLVLLTGSNMAYSQNQKVGVLLASDGTVTPVTADTIRKSALITMNSTNKGFLPPRVALASNTDTVTIAKPAKGLLVYNLGTAGLPYVGYVFWNGTEWRSLDNSTTANAVIATIDCNNATLSPSALTAGIAYTGYISVPYTGGNGAIYLSDGIAIPSTNNTGLTATLQPGQLTYGTGTLTYLVTGTPSQSTPNLAYFDLSKSTQTTTMLGATPCTVGVGTGSGIGVTVKKLLYSGSTSNTTATLNVGRLTFRFGPGAPTIGSASANAGPQMALNTSPGGSPTTIYIGAATEFSTGGYEYNDNTLTYTSANYLVFQNCYSGSQNGIATAELNILNIVDPTNNTYYRVSFYINGPNGNYTYLIIAEEF